MAGIPTNVSPRMQAEFTSAVERTGWTPELERAAAMLPAILRMTPQEFEQWSVPHYLNDAREARGE